nr:MAG TPA: hypothetical protein [Caudoviricetes sp.]
MVQVSCHKTFNIKRGGVPPLFYFYLLFDAMYVITNIINNPYVIKNISKLVIFSLTFL